MNISNQKSADRGEVIRFLDETLDVRSFRDYCPNGLQVEGAEKISSVVTGVTASRALIEAAVSLHADTILVHHGYFWRNENACITGPKQKRIKLLLTNNINLLAYHLPLDSHPELGNNRQLADILGLLPSGRFGEDSIGWTGDVAPEIRTAGDLARRVEERLGRKPLLIGDPAQKISRAAWCSGAAQHFLGDAAAAGASVFLSGEVSEQTFHEAKEFGICYLACGHHATERYGIQALGELLHETFGIRHTFVDIDNPV